MEDKYQELLQQIEEQRAYITALEEINRKLSIAPSYGILTRQALEIELPAVVESVGYIVFGDIDYLHRLNSQIGHEAANEKIRKALQIRSTDIVLAPFLYYSGDEVGILLPGTANPVEFCDRIRDNFAQEGMSITISFVEFTGDLHRDIASAKVIVDQSKAARGGDSR